MAVKKIRMSAEGLKDLEKQLEYLMYAVQRSLRS